MLQVMYHESQGFEQACRHGRYHEKNITGISVLNGTEENKENVYANLKKECIVLIDNKLNENTDLDMKDKLLKVKDKLLRMTYNPNEYVGDIDKVYQLKQSVATD